MTSPEQRLAELRKLLDTGNLKALDTKNKEFLKEDAEVALKENEAKAKVTSEATTQLTEALYQAVKSVPKSVGKLLEVYGNERSIHVTIPLATAPEGILVVASKVAGERKASNGGGKTKDKFGISLNEIFVAHGTPEEIAKHEALPTNDSNGRNQIKVKVRDMAEKEGLIVARA